MACAGEREILGEGSGPAVSFADECEHGIAYEDECDSCDTDTVLPAGHCGHAACARWWVDTGDCDDGPRDGMGAVAWLVGAVVAVLGVLAGYLALAIAGGWL